MTDSGARLYNPLVEPELVTQYGGSGKPVQWERLTAPECAHVVERTDAVLIPLGATEQHGPHLGLCVDGEIAHHVCLGVSALTGVPVVPPLVYGVSGSHGNLPGTLTLRPETMISVLEDIVDSLYSLGVRQFVFVNAHTWNAGPMEVAADKLRVKYSDARVRCIFYVTMYPGPEVDGKVTYGRGLMHANYFETSLMLHIDPEVVHMDRAESLEDRDTFWDYRTDQVSKSGVWGREVELATAENGEREMARCIRTTAKAVFDAVAEPWPQPR
ncbi:creatininase family protein [Rhodococcus sp. IEGM 1379]|uniref:creatininase family protein n=1 Tax=Rhodococcus sp. IEGM 1379 TaxID=3047086 RepID=UPI0024B83430|nr:creatininase family protein [Rhodococcus sp. IEGM 1379]MDI9913997.1 creatininase family protein [Rhodococcus sp. IEGM 1379]